MTTRRKFLLALAAIAGFVLFAGIPTGRIQIGVCDASLQTGAPDLGAMINACYLGANTTSTRAGIIDARNFPVGSNQVVNSDMFAGANKSGTLLLGAYNIYFSAHQNQPQKKMRVIGSGQSSPLSSGNGISNENTVFHPCTGVNTPVTGCTGTYATANNQLFVVPTYSATGTSVTTTATLATSAAHNYTYTSGTCPSANCVASHIVVTGCSVAGYNSGGANPAYFSVLTGTTGSTIKYTTAASGMGAATGCVVQAPARQHGRYSLTGSGLTNPGAYYTLWAQGGGNRGGVGGFDNLGTCGTGPVGSDWTLSGFGATLENIAFSNDGLPGLIFVYSGNEQERGVIDHSTFNNYGGLTAGQAEGNGVMYDRNSWDLNDACANPSGNGGPSHFGFTNMFGDAAPVSNPGGTGASDQAGIAIQLAGNHSESDGTSVQDGGQFGGLAQFGVACNGTIRGLNDSGKGKSNYGIWIQNYDDGTVHDCHFENMFKDPVYISGISTWVSKGWFFHDLDFASSSGSNIAVVHLATGTDNNVVMSIRGAAGSNPAGVIDDVYGCGPTFGAAAPCKVNGLVDGAPVTVYVQGGMNIYNGAFIGNQASGSNPKLDGGTGAPSGACVNGSIWTRTDNGAGSSIYGCKNSAWTALN